MGQIGVRQTPMLVNGQRVEGGLALPSVRAFCTCSPCLVMM